MVVLGIATMDVIQLRVSTIELGMVNLHGKGPVECVDMISSVDVKGKKRKVSHSMADVV